MTDEKALPTIFVCAEGPTLTQRSSASHKAPLCSSDNMLLM